MRRIPIPLLIAAVVATTAILVTLNVKVNPIPIYVEPNITTVIPAGSYVVWKGAANELTVVSNASGTVYAVNGPYVMFYATNGLPVNESVIVDKLYIYGTKNLVGAVIRASYDRGFIYKLINVGNNVYVTDAVNATECRTLMKVVKDHLPILTYCYTGSYVANSTGYYINYSDDVGMKMTWKWDYGGSFTMGPSGVAVKGVAGGVNVAGYPVAWRYITALVISPNANAKVTIVVK
jgi:hypothetical protein